MTANKTLTGADSGLFLLTGSAGALTITMPAVASAPFGALYVFRSTAPQAHVLTSSADAGNAFVAGVSGFLNATGSNANRITFPATVGSSVAMMADGISWIVLASSGAHVTTRL